MYSMIICHENCSFFTSVPKKKTTWTPQKSRSGFLPPQLSPVQPCVLKTELNSKGLFCYKGCLSPIQSVR